MVAYTGTFCSFIAQLGNRDSSLLFSPPPGRGDTSPRPSRRTARLDFLSLSSSFVAGPSARPRCRNEHPRTLLYGLPSTPSHARRRGAPWMILRRCTRGDLGTCPFPCAAPCQAPLRPRPCCQLTSRTIEPTPPLTVCRAAFRSRPKPHLPHRRLEAMPRRPPRFLFPLVATPATSIQPNSYGSRRRFSSSRRRHSTITWSWPCT